MKPADKEALSYKAILIEIFHSFRKRSLCRFDTHRNVAGFREGDIEGLL